MKLSASKAAVEVGKSVPTITRAIKSGKLSAEKVEDGGYLIDAAELFRVFDPVTPVSDETPNTLGHETPNETGMLQTEVKMLREMLALMERTADDLRVDRDKWREQAERATKLLPPPVVVAPAPTAQPESEKGRPSWWRRLVANGR